MKFTKFAAALVFAGVAAISSVQAAEPIQLSLWAPELQLINAGADISGLRLSIYGENNNVKGIDFGFVGVTKGDFTGLGLNFIYSKIDGDFKGVDGYGLCTRVGGNAVGVNWNLLNICCGDRTGVALGLLNIDKQELKGLDWGIVNYCGKLNGVQLGLLNWAESGCGLQVGLVNIFKDGFFPVFPFINFNF